ncbi:MFS transporter [Phreatobacter sp. AB_2022a]|uniref:MFS transporter n=1 Tax=Phreatobacter sp. AB_2022a TaxID=3003134 RepID=UPI002286EED5|nr:MFS transporter [Phreatobacter sp. AB_2022a]MCZ0733478.1 MFS transporter [Phreatobacter sp. AB_2022a]
MTNASDLTRPGTARAAFDDAAQPRPAVALTVLAASFTGVALGYSSSYFYSSGLFILPIAQDLGLSRGAATLGPLVCWLTAAAILPFYGRLMDRAGAIPIAVLSLLGLASAYVLLAAAAQNLLSYLLCSAAVAILGAGSTALPYSRLVFVTFTQRRGMALGAMLTGIGTGAVIVPLGVVPMIQSLGWRSTYLAMAAALVAGAAILAGLLASARGTILAREQAERQGLAGRTAAREIWRSRSFLLLGTAFFAMPLCVISIVVHFVPMLTDAGLSLPEAARLASTLGFASICGRLLTGFLLDKVATERLALALLALALCGIVLLLVAMPSMALLAALILGLVLGAEMDLLAFFAARFFPADAYGAAYSGLFSVFLVGGAVGPGAAGFLFDASGSYALPLQLGGLALAISAAAILALARGTR